MRTILQNCVCSQILDQEKFQLKIMSNENFNQLDVEGLADPAHSKVESLLFSVEEPLIALDEPWVDKVKSNYTSCHELKITEMA